MSGKRHEQRIRTSDSNRRLLDLWPDIYAAGGFEMDGGAVLVLVESNVAIAGVYGHNALYILTALICFQWLQHEEEESNCRGRACVGRLQHRRAVILLPVFG